MKAKITRTSNNNFVKTMNFNTLEELLCWREKLNENIIIGTAFLDDDDSFDVYIEIYDYYRE